MSQHKIIVIRKAGSLSSNSLATDAFNAVSNIPNTTDVQIESEDDAQAEISFCYNSNKQFLVIESHLANFGLERAD